MFRVAFAGFRHPHIFAFYQMVLKHPDTEIVACFEEDEQARLAAEQKGVVFTHDTYEALLAEPDIDFVAVGDYFAKRGSRVIDALRAGKNVYCDKPMCTSLDELDTIEQLVKQTGLKVGCMLDLRYIAPISKVKELLAADAIGEIRQVFFGGQHPLNFSTRAGWYFEEGKHGGTINDIAVHGIDMLYYLAGLKVARINAARCWNAYAPLAPCFKDSAQFMLTLDNGAGVIADVSYASPDSIGYTMPTYWRFDLWGSKGMMEFSYTSNRLMVALNGASEPQVFETEYTGGDDCLSVYLDELNGKPSALDTKTVLYVTRATLDIQAAADAAN